MSVWSFLGDIAETALNFVPGGSTVAKLIPGVSSIFSDADAVAKSKEQLANQRALMQYQNELNLQNWQTQQEFNNYANDLQHMKEAGINPLAFAGASPTSAVSGVSGGTAPDFMSLLNYQRDMKLAQSQLELQRLDAEAKRYENKALKAEADARVAEAKERKDEAEATNMWKNAETKPDINEGWLLDVEKNVWYRTDPETNTVEVMRPGRVRDDIIRSDIARHMDENELISLQKQLNTFETNLRKKYGDVLTASQLKAVQAATRQAILNGDIMKLDVDTFKKLGIGPNVIRAITSTAQAFAGELSGLGSAAAMFFK